MVKPVKDLAGNRFGKLVVLKQDVERESRQAYWICKCDCGNIKSICGASLKNGKQISCGCVRHERLELGRKAITKHGATKTRLYRIYRGIIDRTEYPSNISYRNYGARGIRMCAEWRNDFVAFRDWALSHGYSDNLSIDRIDNNKGYEPNNCRWATNEMQAKNKRPDGKHGHRTFTETQKNELRQARSGEKGSNAKLKAQDVIQMRLMRLSGMSCKEIAEKYPIVTKDTVSEITRGNTWKCLPNTKQELEALL